MKENVENVMSSVPISISGDEEKNVREVEKKLRVIKKM